jgi:ATP-dependent DNA helicase RecG
MLYFFPYKHVDRTRTYTVAELTSELPHVELRGRITRFEVQGEGRHRRLMARFEDGTGAIDLVWFQGVQYILTKYKLNVPYVLFGKPAVFNRGFSISHPELDIPDKVHHLTGHLVPHYSTTDAMKRAYLTSRAIQDIQHNILQSLTDVPETLPPAIIAQERLIPLTQALRDIHFPPNPHALEQARFRLKFEELFYIQLSILRNATIRKQKQDGIPIPAVGDLFNTFYRDHLPFPLTGAQQRVIREIRKNLDGPYQMNRLLQGDVGSGKTLVALFAALLVVDNGHQACIMAPTELLANQHYETFRQQLAPLPVRVELLTGSTPQSVRKKLLPDVARGDVHILIGTHALIEDAVTFDSLALAIIDEQHRFGVIQRARLHKKDRRHPPHILVMTATPIPRTLAMTLYGDLDVSTLDELPPGRKPVKTIHRYDNNKADLYDFLRRQIAVGRQAYVVYPLIEESEKADFKDLEAGYALYREIFPQLRIQMVHGRMKPAEKDAVMQDFVARRTHILMATTVIEVGMNVPNASVMVIESAERFGLAQLHQLRGRVGRGADQSFCVLVTGVKLSEDTRRRIEIMTTTTDGFEIAEADLLLRGHGDLEGTRQSGERLDLRIANLSTDGQILARAREVATGILAADPDLSGPLGAPLQTRLRILFPPQTNFSLIS